MSTKYAAQAASALAMIKAKGEPVAVTHEIRGTLNPVTQVTTGQLTITETFHMVGLPPGQSAAFVVGSLQGKKMLEFHIAPDAANHTFLPGPGDVLTWAGVAYTLSWSSALAPDGGDPLYVKAYGEAV